ncbi:TauD/TfdA family dioxygenase (plasmid) [Agrobacterium tumefaciens]|uniref:TauD/TfdA family dioxygenase n=1 Tax=Agrobacterium tumefaciens TaxID=358 RepID=UPI001574A440|nr:TauD/TfdA family dioxygenase [Agrobacterium tumefaciens]NSZ87683.1 hypothetical protein [Agrobacterium tumefaciens]WCA73007.1 TauD/TfdA family dioxygenase [Agrobacterium tumefaciens]
MLKNLALDARERAFLEQRDIFLEKALKDIGCASLTDVPELTEHLPVVLPPVFIKDFRKISSEEKQALAEQYWGERGGTYFIVLNPEEPSSFSHPLLEIANQISDVIPVKYPMTNPGEGSPEAVARFGPPDGTLKIYNLETKPEKPTDRNLAETSEKFDAHNDGLGYGGAVEVFALYLDSPPIWGGFTFLQNVVRLTLNLALKDPDAFTSLFLPDAITALRPLGRQAIKVTTPVLFLNEAEMPQVFFRLAVDECDIIWRTGIPALERAASYLNHYTKPFAPGSSVIHLDKTGSGIFARNHWVIHGRTPFLDGPKPTERRVLARKWFASGSQHAGHKHVPGMHIAGQFASLYPEMFGPDQVQGAWTYDATAGKNIRKL